MNEQLIANFINSTLYDKELFKEIDKYIYKRYAPLIDFIEQANEHLSTLHPDSFIMFFDVDMSARKYYSDKSPLDKHIQATHLYDISIVAQNIVRFVTQKHKGYFDPNEYKYLFFSHVNHSKRCVPMPKKQSIFLDTLFRIYKETNELSGGNNDRIQLYRCIHQSHMFHSLWIDTPPLILKVKDLYIQMIIGFKMDVRERIHKSDIIEEMYFLRTEIENMACNI